MHTVHNTVVYKGKQSFRMQTSDTTTIKQPQGVKMRFYKEATGFDFYFVTNCDLKKTTT